jgi:hypothetical protein
MSQEQTTPEQTAGAQPAAPEQTSNIQESVDKTFQQMGAVTDDVLGTAEADIASQNQQPPAPEPAAENAAAEPTPEPASETITEPAPEPAPETITEPAPAPEPAPETITEPAPETITEPAPETITEPAPEPETQPGDDANDLGGDNSGNEAGEDVDADTDPGSSNTAAPETNLPPATTGDEDEDQTRDESLIERAEDWVEDKFEKLKEEGEEFYAKVKAIVEENHFFSNLSCGAWFKKAEITVEDLLGFHKEFSAEGAQNENHQILLDTIATKAPAPDAETEEDDATK